MIKIKKLFDYAKNENEVIEQLKKNHMMYFVDPLTKKQDDIITKLFNKELIDIEKGKSEYIFHVLWKSKK